MAAEHIPTDRPAVKSGDFRITGPGRYRLGNGEIVEIEVNDFEPMAVLYPWRRKGSKGIGSYDTWKTSGRIGMPGANMDIVEGPLADEPATRPFTFTGDGLYQLRNGDRVDILRPDKGFLYRANNHSGQTPYLWYWDGKWTGTEEGKQHEYDIVARVEEPLSIDLYGFTAYELAQGAPIAREALYPSVAAAYLHASAGGKPAFVIDLSKVPPDAIVRQEPSLQDKIATYLQDQGSIRSFSNAAADILAMVKAERLGGAS